MELLNLIIALFTIIILVTFIGCAKQENKLVLTIVIGTVAMVAVYFTCGCSGSGVAIAMKKAESFVGGAPIDYVVRPGKCDALNLMGKNDITPVVGNYDGLIVKGGVKPDYPILPADKVAYHSPVGDAYALNPDPNMTPTYAPIDGKEGSPRMMSMFAYNRSSPDCCPSTFSSDRGCVCMSQEQRDFINRRGNQKHENGNPDF